MFISTPFEEEKTNLNLKLPYLTACKEHLFSISYYSALCGQIQLNVSCRKALAVMLNCREIDNHVVWVQGIGFC